MPDVRKDGERRTFLAFLVTSASSEDTALISALEGAGFGVKVLKDFGEAREAARDFPPDLILLRARGTLGPELALYSSLKLLLDNAFIPLVVAADAPNPEEEVMALSSGVDAYLTAPFHPMVFSARLHSLLRIKALHDELLAANERLQELSRVDPGTGIYNRRYFFERLDQEFARVRRRGEAMSVMMLDIDNFKAVNDRFGHLFGDFVLRRLAETLQNISRRIDVVARYGGEEFAFILPATDLNSAVNLAERVRRTVAGTAFRQEDAEMNITVSIGVVEARQCEAPDPDHLVMCADKALYEAKALGRNRLSVYHSESRPISENEPPPASP